MIERKKIVIIFGGLVVARDLTQLIYFRHKLLIELESFYVFTAVLRACWAASLLKVLISD